MPCTVGKLAHTLGIQVGAYREFEPTTGKDQFSKARDRYIEKANDRRKEIAKKRPMIDNAEKKYKDPILWYIVRSYDAPLPEALGNDAAALARGIVTTAISHMAMRARRFWVVGRQRKTRSVESNEARKHADLLVSGA